MKHLLNIVVLALCAGMILPCTGSTPEISVADRLYAYNVNTSQHAIDMYLTALGPIGARGWVYINRIYIHDVEAGAPADGLLQQGDYLLGANGQMFPLNDPRPLLGKAIDKAEAADGSLILRVGNKGKERDVPLQLNPIGGRSATWPFDCKKSTVIRENALRWLREHQSPQGGFPECISVYASLNGLFLLSSPAPEDQEAARRAIYDRADGPPAEELNAWCYGYSALALAEYYLATGDSVVIPRLKFYAKEIANGQTKCGSWCHGMVQGGIPGGYGEMNNPAVVCFLSLVLIQKCGIEVDRDALARSTKFFGRYAGLGSIPYGDGLPWDRWPSSTGKDATAALAFRVLGDPEIVRAFAESVCLESGYVEDAHTGAFWGRSWLPLGAHLATAAQFHNCLNNLNWYCELERRWDGGFEYLPNPENLTGITGFGEGAAKVTGGLGLVYSLPLMSLTILGALPGPFATGGAPELKPAVALFAEKKWDDFDALTKYWPDGTANSPAAQLMAKRAAVQNQISWTIGAINKMAGQDGLTRIENDKAKAMLNAVERLAGKDLDQAKQLRTRLAACKELPAAPVPPVKKQPVEQNWKHLLPLAQDIAQDASAKTWRVYAWKGDISPVLDNLEPAGEAMKGWYLPEFDDAKWEKKTAPFRAHERSNDVQFEGQPSSPVSHHDCMYQPRPLFNTYARMEFTVDSTDGIKAAQIVQQNCHQYLRSECYLNGYRVVSILRPKTCELSPEALKLLRKGKNTLAVYITSCRGHLHDFDFGIDIVKE